MDDNVRKNLDDSLKLYSLPQTLVEVLRLVRDETSSADDLAGVLIKDPALTAKVLRVVNSPFYGMGRQVGTVSQAVVTLGMRQITALALSASIYGMTDDDQSVLDRVRFWRHSLEVAIATRAIAEEVGGCNPEESFITGLLHDIGLLVLERSFPDQFPSIWKKAARGETLTDLEEDAWGTNHARIGQFLLEQWRLPESICEAVGRHHHVFPEGADEPDMVLSQVVNLAERVAHFGLYERSGVIEDLSRSERDVIRDNLRLTPTKLVGIEKELLNRTIEESKYLEMDIGTPEDLLVEANQMLFRQYESVESLLEDNRRMHQQFAGEQVKTGFLESFKTTAAAFTEYLERSSLAIFHQIEQVRGGLDSGSIVDPAGLVADSATNIEARMNALKALMAEMKSLTATESALYYDQSSVEAVETRIREQIKESGQLTAVS